MSSHKTQSVSVSKNLAKRQCKSITLEEKMEVTRRMDDGQSCPAG
jgi:hypothetical protein